MNIKVTKDNITIDKESYNTHKGEYNSTICTFNFSDEYKDLVKIANFTIQSSRKTYEIDIVNDKCNIPYEVLEKEYETIILGVYGYTIDENENLILRLSPSPDTFIINTGSYSDNGIKPEIITPSQYEIYSNSLNKGLEEMNKTVEANLETISDELEIVKQIGQDTEKIGSETEKQGKYAEEQGNYAKDTADSINKQVENGVFTGKSIEYDWKDTSLGIKREDETEYKYTDLKGEKGDTYTLTDDDKKDIAEKTEDLIKPTLDSNLKKSKDYTENYVIKDIKEVNYDEDTATFTFTRHDDTQIVVDLPIEQLLKDGFYDEENKELVLVLEDNKEIRIPASGLIDDYSTEDTDTIQLSLSANNVFKALIKGQSINKTHLSTDLQDEIDNKLTEEDLTDYVKNTDYATSSKGGVIKTATGYQTQIDSYGHLTGLTVSYANYNNALSNAFITKGTLENVITGKDLAKKADIEDYVDSLDASEVSY